MKKCLKWVLAALSILLLVGCGNQNKNGGDDANSDEPRHYKIGVVSDRAKEIWEFALEDLEKEGDIDVEIVKFDDFIQPNKALSEGEIDANAYQYYTFLYDYLQDSGNKDELYPMGYLSAEPLGIWTVDGINSKEDIPENAQIAILNDPVNTGNALKLLDENGLIKLKDDAPLVPTEEDIESTYKNLELVPMDYGAVPRALGDVEMILAGSTSVTESGIDLDDAMILEDMENSNPMLRLNFVVRKEDKDNKDLQKILDAYQRQEVIDYANETGAGDFYDAWDNDDVPSEDMQEYADYMESHQNND